MFTMVQSGLTGKIVGEDEAEFKRRLSEEWKKR